jgi:hypothetical protein
MAGPAMPTAGRLRSLQCLHPGHAQCAQLSGLASIRSVLAQRMTELRARAIAVNLAALSDRAARCAAVQNAARKNREVSGRGKMQSKNHVPNAIANRR